MTGVQTCALPIFNNIVTGVNDTIRISHDAGATWNVLTIPTGMYQIENLQAWLMVELQSLGYATDVTPTEYDYMIYYNESTNKCYWMTKNNNYWIDLTNNGQSTFNNMIGFTTTLLQNSTTYIAETQANFNWRDGMSFLIRTNLVKGTSDGDIIYEGNWQSDAFEIELFPSAFEYHFEHDLSPVLVQQGRIDNVEVRITKIDSNETIPFNASDLGEEAVVISFGLQAT